MNFFSLVLLFFCFSSMAEEPSSPPGETVSFPSGTLTLHGVIYKPHGSGPFPAILYNHGSALETNKISDVLGPVFASQGWLFFMPSRRGQGLSCDAGSYIGDEIDAARSKGGMTAAAETMVRILKTDHLNDQLAALAWLKQQKFVQKDRIAVAGNSFGGIQTVLGAERGSYCAAIDSAGAAQSWAKAPEIQALMIHAVKNTKAPIFFFQAENDFDLSPSRTLSKAMRKAGKTFKLKIYPPYGKTTEDGHTLGYFGKSVWEADVFEFLEKHCER